MNALQAGELTTAWSTITGVPEALQTFANIPANSNITVVVEVGDASGKIIDSKAIELKTGARHISLAVLKAGTQLRLRAKITAIKVDLLPVLQTAAITSGGKVIRWSTSDEC